jgi:aryl-alcohol dehydrogenase
MSKNTTQIKAAVVREKGGPFHIETLTLEAPRRDEVLVKVVATGMSHTDMVARDKGYPVRRWLLSAGRFDRPFRLKKSRK